MTKEVRRVLDIIEDVLLRQDQDANDLAAILSALKGPDDPSVSTLKLATTCCIRGQAFPRLLEVWWAYLDEKAIFNLLWEMSAGEPIPQPVGAHFNNHVILAIEALNREETKK